MAGRRTRSCPFPRVGKPRTAVTGLALLGALSATGFLLLGAFSGAPPEVESIVNPLTPPSMARISPATSNQNLKFERKFDGVFPAF